jgi:hypothetical protein
MMGQVRAVPSFLLTGSKQDHEASETDTAVGRKNEHRKYVRFVAVRTLTAPIHSAFSWVLSALHSLRMAGFMQDLNNGSSS